VIHSASELLSLVGRHLPPALVTPTARARLRRCATRVPAEWFAGCVECRLDSDERVDFLVCATRGDGGQRAIARALREGHGPAFGDTVRLLGPWGKRGTFLHREVSAVWLEYDLAVENTPPFAFVSLYPDYLDGLDPRHVGRPMDPRRVRALAAAGLNSLAAREVEQGTLELIEHCAESLPPSGRLLHVATMPTRGHDRARIGAILPYSGVRGWLARIGWRGESTQLDELFQVIGDGFAFLHVQIELDEHIRPRVAFDFQRGVWHEFVERLLERRSYSRDKLAAALRWPGHHSKPLADGFGRLRIERQMFFKVVASPDGSLDAKVYLCFEARPSLFC
jgi:hypothetical protein